METEALEFRATTPVGFNRPRPRLGGM